jgi:hypothetical protein
VAPALDLAGLGLPTDALGDLEPGAGSPTLSSSSNVNAALMTLLKKNKVQTVFPKDTKDTHAGLWWTDCFIGMSKLDSGSRVLCSIPQLAATRDLIIWFGTMTICEGPVAEWIRRWTLGQ